MSCSEASTRSSLVPGTCCAALPRRAREYALPQELRTRLGIRRYGFHGISHAQVAAQVATAMSRKPQDLGAEIAESSITEDDDALIPPDLELRGDLKRRRHRFREDRSVVVDRVWHGVQVALGDGDEICKRTITTDDPDHGAMRTVPRMTSDGASVARPATAIDLTDHAATLERTPKCGADEFMSEHAAKAVISREDLKIRLADAGPLHADHYLSRSEAWLRTVGLEPDD